jgi:hypothetical protein
MLARVYEIGREQSPELPDPCLTCAFRAGSMPNQCAGTGKVTLDCLLRADTFGCHHGMKNGEPSKLCVGWVAALKAPFKEVQHLLGEMYAELQALPDADPVRAEFDAWVKSIDPEGSLDVYQLGRAYAAKAA